MINHLSVCAFTVIHIAQATAYAPHAWGDFHVPKKPPGNVHLVNALIA